ncbi:MAG: NAD(P)-binding domain-containing protein [Planctomycetes bacterium]|nr:NAD(P)-binding domain-containing protein [Planctomycetota bacterium]MCB9891695.1 NAD(P)-binding domain-containing protein [Planctomycetota bacterium]MCB9918748.1 NAD(P)-binding domain-containing protein [Planctomycetota bacterium]
MTLVFLIILIALALLASATLLRRSELGRIREGLEELEKARARGSDKARLQYPHVDLSQCIGCGACVRACPENGVLALVHGQAVVVHGSRCVGHSLCAEACPTAAIAVRLSDVSDRNDLPAIDDKLESSTMPGVFLAGELTGFALIRTAIQHGRQIAREITQRIMGDRSAQDRTFDVVIVGAGPAGLACALEAREAGLRYVALERDAIGGTIAHYPRRKLVMTQPVDLPVFGRLDRSSYSKEELIEIWHSAVDAAQLDVRCGELFETLTPTDGGFALTTSTAVYDTRFVVLALGRRGTPRKLGVPGEDSTKVAYSLIDAESYQGRRALVVGGGDSAIEAALALAEQPGNSVTLSYRRSSFTRIKARNEARIHEAIHEGRIQAIMESDVRAIEDDCVHLACKGSESLVRLDNDDVFVFAGGIPPFDLLEKCGVSFDPKDREQEDVELASNSHLLWAILAAVLVSLGAWGWIEMHGDYYKLEDASRPLHDLHERLAPSRGIGLLCGVAGTACILLNLMYLWKRSRFGAWLRGSLRAWMTSHVITGVLSLALIVVHAGVTPRDSNGGHAYLALVIVVGAGIIGRYLYAFVPRAANGRELAVEEVRTRFAQVTGKLDSQDTALRESIEARLSAGALDTRWHGSGFKRILRGLTIGKRWREVASEIDRLLDEADLAKRQKTEILALAESAFRSAWQAAHIEELRGLLASWRWMHRWLALLMVLLAAIHIVTALRYAKFSWG